MDKEHSACRVRSRFLKPPIRSRTRSPRSWHSVAALALAALLARRQSRGFRSCGDAFFPRLLGVERGLLSLKIGNHFLGALNCKRLANRPIDAPKSFNGLVYFNAL